MTAEQLLRHYFTVEMTRNIDAIVELYATDATFRTPDLTRCGHADIRPFYEDAARRFPDLDVSIVNAFDRGDWAVAEWEAVMSGPSSGTVHLTGVNVAHFTDGLITDVQSYYDTGSYAATS